MEGKLKVVYGFILAFMLTGTVNKALAECPQELAVYEAANGNLLEFSGNSDASMKFHQIGILLQQQEADDLVLEAFVEKTHGLQQGEMTVRYQCPDGDIPLDDLEKCTIYQSVVYGADRNGILAELPLAGDPAARSIVLPNFTADVWMHEAWSDSIGLKRPAEIFHLSGCLE